MNDLLSANELDCPRDVGWFFSEPVDTLGRIAMIRTLGFVALVANFVADAAAQEGSIVVHEKYDFTISIYYDVQIGEEPFCFLAENADEGGNSVEASEPKPMQWYRFKDFPDVQPPLGKIIFAFPNGEGGPSYGVERMEPFSSFSDTLLLRDESLPSADEISIIVRYLGFRCDAVRSGYDTEHIPFTRIGNGGEFLDVDPDAMIVIESEPFDINMHVNGDIYDREGDRGR